MRKVEIFTPEKDDEKWCAGCIACCCWPGDVFFSPESIPNVAACLGLDERECTDSFFEVNKSKQCLQTKPTHDGRCIFISSDGCRIYPHRPPQCRNFPYEWHRPEEKLMNECALYAELKKRKNNEHSL
jgi:Fe-S-cluster containining protein